MFSHVELTCLNAFLLILNDNGVSGTEANVFFVVMLLNLSVCVAALSALKSAAGRHLKFYYPFHFFD